MVEIIAVHMVGDERHEHIAEVQWWNPETDVSNKSSRESMVEFIRDKKGYAYVLPKGGTKKVRVSVVKVTPPYIRTYADKVWTNNLLALPRY